MVPDDSSFCYKCGNSIDALDNTNATTNMYCRKCGASVPDDYNFCYSCGEKKIINSSQSIVVDFDDFKNKPISSQFLDKEPYTSDYDTANDTKLVNLPINNSIDPSTTAEFADEDNRSNSILTDTDVESSKASFIKGLLSIMALIMIISLTNTLFKNYKSSGSIGAAFSDTVEALSNLGNRTNNNSKQDMEIYNITKDIIRDDLTTPSTAKFPAFNMKFISYNNSVYTVSAYVDHDNLMGATVRSYFTVEITEIENGFRYKILEQYQ